MGERRPEIMPLTGLRFIAAMSVVFSHFTGPLGIDEEKAHGFAQYAFYRLFDAGDEAVQLFFVLSGFVLTYTYQRDGGMRGTPAQFYIARIARIYPAYVVGFVLAAAPYFWAGPDMSRSAWTTGSLTLFLLQGFDRNGLPWNGPAWSLSVEAVFYLLFPLLLPLFADRKSRTMLLILAGCWLLTFTGFWLWRAGLISYGAALQNPLVHLPQFLIGIAVATLFMRGDFNALVGRLPCSAVVAVIVGARFC